ncbi:hypothetical protein E8E12_009154 [Didymella heteroderae]|uniref:Histone H4 n=1 Tax=Didymella heteroderae TaxID=1769908 RepID=A0A9P4WXD7_9PLEO|nr:hypothetical protein E8E12_009154 [Didymella heteroderae]
MVNERSKQFGGMPRFGVAPRPGFAPLSGSSQTASPSASLASQLGIGLGKGGKGLGLGKGKGVKRHQKIQRDTIQGVTKGDIRLSDILREVIAIAEHTGRTTVCVTDIIFILNRQGRQLYGFDPAFIARR